MTLAKFRQRHGLVSPTVGASRPRANVRRAARPDAFSFLEATPLPEALAERAAQLEQPAVALVDADGLYGAPQLYRACTRLGLKAIVGAEVTLDGGGRLPLLVEDCEGYKNLCRLLTRIKMRAPKGKAAATFDDLAARRGWSASRAAPGAGDGAPDPG